MKINLATTFTDLEGNLLVDAKGSILTLKTVLSSTLSVVRSEMAPERSWELAQELFTSTEEFFEIKIEELAQVKNALKGHNWANMVIAQAFKSFEG